MLVNASFWKIDPLKSIHRYLFKKVFVLADEEKSADLKAFI